MVFSIFLQSKSNKPSDIRGFAFLPTTDYTKTIECCYRSDKDLIDKYHVIAPSTLKECVEHTVSVFIRSQNFTMYELSFWGRFAGYIGVEKSDITTIKGFFLMPEFRVADHYLRFFNTIKEIAGGVAHIPVYDKNKRANSFLLKNNCIFVIGLHDEVENQPVNIYKLCHLEDY